jgi:hypothetical protein
MIFLTKKKVTNKNMHKSLILILLISIGMLLTAARRKPKAQIVEAACGQCQFGLQTQNNSCDLAIRLNGKAYFVDGSHIDQHGDAHDSLGFCNAIRKAKVKGQVLDGRFKAKSFKVLAVK